MVKALHLFLRHQPKTPKVMSLYVASGMPLMTGVERTESSSRAKAANSRTDSGVAGFSSILAGQTAAPGASPGGIYIRAGCWNARESERARDGAVVYDGASRVQIRAARSRWRYF